MKAKVACEILKVTELYITIYSNEDVKVASIV